MAVRSLLFSLKAASSATTMFLFSSRAPSDVHSAGHIPSMLHAQNKVQSDSSEKCCWVNWTVRSILQKNWKLNIWCFCNRLPQFRSRSGPTLLLTLILLDTSVCFLSLLSQVFCCQGQLWADREPPHPVCLTSVWIWINIFCSDFHICWKIQNNYSDEQASEKNHLNVVPYSICGSGLKTLLDFFYLQNIKGSANNSLFF